MSRLHKDFQEVYEFYVQSFIDTIGKQYGHVDVAEVQSIWEETLKPVVRKRRHTLRNTASTTASTLRLDVDLEYEKRKKQLEMMRYDDLFRHCVRNGLQPPNNKDDMVRVILTRMYPS